jgi:iron complex transport system substrate-binding protein
VSLEPNNLKDVFATFLAAGRALEREDRAEEVVKELKQNFAFIQETVSRAQQQKPGDEKKKPLVAFLEWHDPFFTGGHWIADMMEIAGCDYPMSKSGDRSKPMSDEDFQRLDPDYILIGPCGFPLERALNDTKTIVAKKPWWKSMRAVKNGNVYALDGNSYYARPGPRLLQGCGLIARCVHGEDVGAALGEKLAPVKGMQRVTLDMYRTTTSE